MARIFQQTQAKQPARKAPKIELDIEPKIVEPQSDIVVPGFDKQHPTALAFYCSDGRFTNGVAEMMKQQGHVRFDTVNLPGGAATLDMTSATMVEAEATRGAVSFLIKGHGIKTAYLIAHQGCGFYGKRFPATGTERQVKDIQKAAIWLERNHPGLVVQLMLVSTDDGVLRFKQVPKADPSTHHMVM